MLKQYIELAIYLEALYSKWKPNSIIYSNCIKVNWLVSSKGIAVHINRHTISNEIDVELELIDSLKDFTKLCKFASVSSFVTLSTLRVSKIKRFKPNRQSTYRRIVMNPFVKEGLATSFIDVFENVRKEEYRLHP